MSTSSSTSNTPNVSRMRSGTGGADEQPALPTPLKSEELRLNVQESFDQLNQILSQELANLSTSQKHLDSQIEQCSKRLLDELRKLKSEVHASVKEKTKLEKKYNKSVEQARKQHQKKLNTRASRHKRLQHSRPSQNPPPPSKELPVQASTTRSAAPIILQQRIQERQRSMENRIAQREQYLLEKLDHQLKLGETVRNESSTKPIVHQDNVVLSNILSDLIEIRANQLMC